jgi:hypothetical protein
VKHTRGNFRGSHLHAPCGRLTTPSIPHAVRASYKPLVHPITYGPDFRWEGDTKAQTDCVGTKEDIIHDSHVWRPSFVTGSTVLNRRTTWGVQRGRGWPQAACPVGGPLLKQLYSPFRDDPPTGRKGEGMAGLSDSLESPWPPLAIRACS